MQRFILSKKNHISLISGILIVIALGYDVKKTQVK